jgi:hypothetical protein
MPFELNAQIPLATQTPQIDPFRSFASVLQLRGMQEQNEALAEQRRTLAEQRRLQIEQAKRDQAEGEALRGLFVNGQPTAEQIYSIVGPARGAEIVKGLAAIRTQEVKDEGELRGVIGTTLGGLNALPENLRPEMYQAIRSQFVQRGWVQPDQVPEQYSPEFVTMAQQWALTPKEQLEYQNPKPVEVNGSLVSVRPGAAPETIYTAPETPQQKAAREHQEKVFAETQRHNRATEASSAAANAGSSSPMTADGLEVAAWQYIQTGAMPPLGMGKQAADARMKILNRAGELQKAGGNDPVMNAALYKADSQALVQTQKTLSAITAFENTAKKNLDVMEREAKRIVDAGAPWINRPLRSLGVELGSPQLTAFNTARQAVVPEIARILTNPNLTGVLSDQARQEIDELLRGDASMKQMLEAIRILKTDMQTRHTSLVDERNAIQKRIGSRGRSSMAAPGAVPAPGPGAPVAAPGGAVAAGRAGLVPMIAPDGGLLMVPHDRVKALEAQGARRQ